ncbi:hypothetical protein PBI_CLEO_1 [Gordonia phage Cleo]|nr:hypothetical protein PBI_CLEO_1 [Gordonia phage Cleo]
MIPPRWMARRAIGKEPTMAEHPARNASREDWATFLGYGEDNPTDKSRDELIAEYDLRESQDNAKDTLDELNDELSQGGTITSGLVSATPDFGVLAGDGAPIDNDGGGFSVLA